MAKTHVPKIRHPLSEDEAGVVYSARDAAGNRLNLRKPKADGPEGKSLNPEEEEAYQGAVSKLSAIHHPSLFQVVSGHTDPEDELPFLTIKPVDGEILSEKLKSGPLSVETTTALLTQALEACDLVSHLLGEEGVWIETQPENILIIEEHHAPRFIFWPAPLKAVCAHGKSGDFGSIIELTERVLDWKDREVDEREGGHLQLWLKWMKTDGDAADIHEAREMIAAAAGVEPPAPVAQLIDQSKRKPGLSVQMPKMPPLMKLKVPKMPLLTILSVMFVIQAGIGWFIVRKINENTDDRLQQMNSDYWSTPYTIDHDPSRAHERGSQPVDLD